MICHNLRYDLFVLQDMDCAIRKVEIDNMLKNKTIFFICIVHSCLLMIVLKNKFFMILHE